MGPSFLDGNRPSRRHSGALAPVVALGGILLATLLDPSFSWTGDALSHLGVREPSAVAFNGALVVGGSLAVPYAHLLYERSGRRMAPTERATADPRAGRALGLVFGVAGVCLAGVGLFPMGHPLHLPAAVGFYLLATVAFLIDGLARRDQYTGTATLRLAVIHVLVWATWGAGWWPGTGLALPEFAGALLVAVWVWWLGPLPALRAERGPE